VTPPISTTGGEEGGSEEDIAGTWCESAKRQMPDADWSAAWRGKEGAPVLSGWLTNSVAKP